MIASKIPVSSVSETSAVQVMEHDCDGRLVYREIDLSLTVRAASRPLVIAVAAHTTNDTNNKSGWTTRSHAGWTAKTCHPSGTPLSVWIPRSSNRMPEPATRSFTVEDTTTSSDPASQARR